jgi:hypothetical protein
VVLLVGLEKGEHGEVLHELVSIVGASETLQHFLAITAKSQRPD